MLNSLRSRVRANHPFDLMETNIFNLTKADAFENFKIFFSIIFLLNTGMHFTLFFSCFICHF